LAEALSNQPISDSVVNSIRDVTSIPQNVEWARFVCYIKSVEGHGAMLFDPGCNSNDISFGYVHFYLHHEMAQFIVKVVLSEDIISAFPLDRVHGEFFDVWNMFFSL
jgi:hypothetical protein